MSCPPGEIVTLNPYQMRLVGRELRQRLAAYERKGLPTKMEQGKSSRIERMRAGILGECAALVYFGQPAALVISRGQLDGGTDLVIGDLPAQVKTSLTLSPRYCYTPRHIPFKADVLIQAAVAGYNTVRLVGYLPRDEYEKRRRPIKLGGWCEFFGVTVSELRPVRLLASDRQPGLPF